MKKTKSLLKDEIKYMNAYCWKYFCTLKLGVLFIVKGTPQSVRSAHNVLVTIILNHINLFLCGV